MSKSNLSSQIFYLVVINFQIFKFSIFQLHSLRGLALTQVVTQTLILIITNYLLRILRKRIFLISLDFQTQDSCM